MQEQKKYQIEKVIHSEIYDLHTCCVIDYYEKSDNLIQCNFSDQLFAKYMSVNNSIGMWRIKQQNLKQSKN